MSYKYSWIRANVLVTWDVRMMREAFSLNHFYSYIVKIFCVPDWTRQSNWTSTSISCASVGTWGYAWFPFLNYFSCTPAGITIFHCSPDSVSDYFYLYYLFGQVTLFTFLPSFLVVHILTYDTHTLQNRYQSILCPILHIGDENRLGSGWVHMVYLNPITVLGILNRNI